MKKLSACERRITFYIEKKTVQKGIKPARFSWVVGGLQTLKAFIYKAFSDLVLGSNPPLPTKTV